MTIGILSLKIYETTLVSRLYPLIAVAIRGQVFHKLHWKNMPFMAILKNIRTYTKLKILSTPRATRYEKQAEGRTLLPVCDHLATLRLHALFSDDSDGIGIGGNSPSTNGNLFLIRYTSPPLISRLSAKATWYIARIRFW